jgi:hypothetical protein
MNKRNPAMASGKPPSPSKRPDPMESGYFRLVRCLTGEQLANEGSTDADEMPAEEAKRKAYDERAMEDQVS